MPLLYILAAWPLKASSARWSQYFRNEVRTKDSQSLATVKDCSTTVEGVVRESISKTSSLRYTRPVASQSRLGRRDNLAAAKQQCPKVSVSSSVKKVSS
ncbi:hypothetical protein F5X97DRAFT_284323 [Nemania serpens]|nr:hypothetical protein F5X97DRAFT_284323 [Nemania serpens]